MKRIGISSVLLLILTSCAHVDYPRTAELDIGEGVLVTNIDAVSDCHSIGNVYGKIKNGSIDSAVKSAFNMARNEAAQTQGNVIIYEETKYLKSVFDHAILVQFSSYYCADMGKVNSVSESMTEASSQASEEARKEAMIQASNQAFLAAQQAALSAASAAAASAAATQMMMMTTP